MLDTTVEIIESVKVISESPLLGVETVRQRKNGIMRICSSC